MMFEIVSIKPTSTMEIPRIFSGVLNSNYLKGNPQTTFVLIK